MVKIKTKNGKVIVAHGKFKILREKEIEITYGAGSVLLSVSDCFQEEVYFLDMCYCKEKDKIKIYVKINCDKFEEFFSVNESKTFKGLSITLLGFNKDRKCF